MAAARAAMAMAGAASPSSYNLALRQMSYRFMPGRPSGRVPYPRSGTTGASKGLALVTVLWVLVLLSLIAASFLLLTW